MPRYVHHISLHSITEVNANKAYSLHHTLVFTLFIALDTVPTTKSVRCSTDGHVYCMCCSNFKFGKATC